MYKICKKTVRKIYKCSNCDFCKVFDEKCQHLGLNLKGTQKGKFFCLLLMMFMEKIIFVRKCDVCSIYHLRFLNEIKV